MAFRVPHPPCPGLLLIHVVIFVLLLLQALQELGLAGRPPEDGGATSTAVQLVPAATGTVAPALRITAEEARAMLEALDGPRYKNLERFKGRPLINLLVRLNERVLERNQLPYVNGYNAADKWVVLPGWASFCPCSLLCWATCGPAAQAWSLPAGTQGCLFAFGGGHESCACTA